MMDNMYYIENCGCDDTTCGLAIIPDEMFETFKNIIKDLNKNSTYSCMPTINVYKISKDDLREATDEDCRSNTLHLGEEKYVLKDICFSYNSETRVI